MVESLGHEVVTLESWNGERCDVLVALHARKSFLSVDRFYRARPGAFVVVALTGTDLYADLPQSAEAQRSIDLATRLIALQPKASEALPKSARHKVRVIYQSVPPISPPADPWTGSGDSPGESGDDPGSDGFDVCVLSHLRAVKDPLLAAKASRLLPADSRIRILHAGRALEDALAQEARAEEATNPRYRWLGELPRRKAWEILARSRLLVLTSLLEGGANVVSEAIVAAVPVVSSRISGSIGLLGDDYPGYFPVRDPQALAALLRRIESDVAFYADLKARCAARQPLFEPARERDAWRALLAELEPPGVRLSERR